MVLGLNAKNKRGSSVHVNYLIHIQEIKPWPPSQSLRSLRSVLVQWENGERNSGSTNPVVPSIGSDVCEGKIEFHESFVLPVTLLREASVRGRDAETFQKNSLEFNLYERRRDKTQLLATAVLDLADYGVVKDALSVSAPMNSKRSFRNTSEPVLYLKIQPVDKIRASSSRDNNGFESVSALMNEEYAEEAESASFTDDDVPSHSSLIVSSSAFESNGTNANGRMGNKGDAQQISEENTFKHSSTKVISSADISQMVEKLGSLSSAGDLFNGEAWIIEKSYVEEAATPVNIYDNSTGVIDGEKQEKIDDSGNQVYLESDTLSLSRGNLPMKGNILKSDRQKHVKSVRSPSDSFYSNEFVSCSQHAETKEASLPKDMQNGVGNLTIDGRKDAKVYPKDARSAILDIKVQQLEQKIKMLEGELRETAAIEAAIYSVVAEHGSSMSKVHAPARRLSRLYLHACNESHQPRRASAARSAVSGLVLVAKACGNDVPRLTFWLSNSVVLRATISHAISAGPRIENKVVDKGKKGISSPLKWKEYSPSQKENKTSIHRSFGDWEDPYTFTSALERIEGWIFTRVIESVWWQTLTPHMQSAAAKEINRDTGSGLKIDYRSTSSSGDQDQENLSSELWKKAFKDACERLCPVRAGGHECGCLPVLARLIMEQCVARLDVAMFNAILRETDDEIPTDPVSDPISDSKVLPIPGGKASFGAGAQLKNAIGNWSRWLTDLFGMDDDDDARENENDGDGNYERHETSFKSFHLLNALSDLMMLPKDMLLSRTIRKEVCPAFSTQLIKRVLDNFFPDEFCPDPIPDVVLEALESEDPLEAGEECVTNIPCIAAPPVYLPPSAVSLAGIISGEGGSESQLRRSGSSVIKKAYTSDDELEELNSPMSSILMGASQPSPVPGKPSWRLKENGNLSAVRYDLLRDMWMNRE
ncbi:NT-C2 domain-containing protein [Cephalotus follicularis]|uniref:NT-C2 domain-containing protein n=1 Tax=Cephalotus follicularis TaxID=3775 RepID=A0A1Q3B8S1_CEPFO|nr:NT-C2 domain-containing protein [Cephalotus follicularis]